MRPNAIKITAFEPHPGMTRYDVRSAHGESLSVTRADAFAVIVGVTHIHHAGVHAILEAAAANPGFQLEVTPSLLA